VAACYGGGISTMIDEMKFPGDDILDIVLAGSVFVKGGNPVLIDALKGSVGKLSPDYNINYNVLDVPPVAGAVIWALNTLNGKSVYYDKVCAEFRRITF